MTSVRLRPVYEDNKTYPILVPLNGGRNRIVEMLGKDVSKYNRNLVCPCCGRSDATLHVTKNGIKE